MKTILALQDAGILDQSEKLTGFAISNSKHALSRGSVLTNLKVVSELTKDGSDITDWMKLKTPSIELPTGQKVQVHFYQHSITGEINYNIDFKVKGLVHPFPTTPRFEPTVPPYSP